jgi:hypothetical protein
MTRRGYRKTLFDRSLTLYVGYFIRSGGVFVYIVEHYTQHQILKTAFHSSTDEIHRIVIILDLQHRPGGILAAVVLGGNPHLTGRDLAGKAKG